MQRRTRHGVSPKILAVVAGTVIIGLVVAQLIVSLTGGSASLVAKAGLGNDCRVTYNNAGEEVCSGDFNGCRYVTSEEKCTAAGCTWKPGKEDCVKTDGDSPACSNIPVRLCGER